MNSIKDILRNNIIQMGMVETLSPAHIVLILGTALACAIIIYCVYKFFYKGAVYSENFGLLIVLSSMTTAFVIMTISSNLVLSLGMVGALSIVRFRAAVKDPLDVGFLFLAIGAGLTAGAGLFLLALIGTVSICLIFSILFVIGKNKASYLLVVSCESSAEEDVRQEVDRYKNMLKSKSYDGEMIEFIFTVRIKEDAIVDRLLALDGVEKALLVAYTGDAEY